jgi:hypothetical protein
MAAGEAGHEPIILPKVVGCSGEALTMEAVCD